jgi:hypothetical protein
MRFLSDIAGYERTDRTIDPTIRHELNIFQIVDKMAEANTDLPHHVEI